ncbi:MAG: type II toxin-antitoxin system PemK/MazF family toxin [Armatimonadota bacterium]
MHRGEVWWAQIPKPVGKRPVVLLSRTKAITVRQFVTVAEISTTIRKIPVEVPLGQEDGLPKACVANLDVINTIPKKFLVKHICKLSNEKISEIENALKFALGLEQ